MSLGESHEHSTGEPTCPAEVRGILAAMEQSMEGEPNLKQMGIPVKTAVDLIRSGKASSFSQFEGWLRELGSRAHFIAVPLDYYSPGWVGKIRYPLEAEDEPEYTLWVELKGSAWVQAKLEFLGVSPEENRERLLTTGLPSKA